MKASLNLQHSQQLSLTPELRQSLKLLHLSAVDLELEIQEILDTNPLLELEEREITRDLSPQEIATAESERIPQPVSEASDPSLEMERTDNLAPEQDLSFNNQEPFESRRTSETVQVMDNSAGEFTQVVTTHETLFEHMQWQLQLTTLSDKDQLIGHTLLRSVDENGYLTSSVEEIAALFDPEMEVDVSEVEAVLSLIKTLEPVGIGARNLAERLDLLLALLPAETPGLATARVIVSQHLQLLAARNIQQLKKVLGLSAEELADSLALITAQNPRVANQFTAVDQNYLVADVVVKKVGNKWVAGINPENQAKLRINDTYVKLLKPSLDAAGNAFIQEHLQQARNIVKGLLSRYDTLLMVGQAIVARQQAFFEHGEQQMQPMVLHDIAEELGLHESTISRATNGKYLLSPSGLYEMKFFFSSSLSNAQGASSSSTAIRSLIRKMVDAESKQKPLSDSRIAKLLEQQGHIVARRTIAKYRDKMQIAPSSQRKALL